MARKADDILRDVLGAQILQIAHLTAQLEAAREELAALKAEKPGKATKP